jgi:hypothetical protein
MADKSPKPIYRPGRGRFRVAPIATAAGRCNNRLGALRRRSWLVSCGASQDFPARRCWVFGGRLE